MTNPAITRYAVAGVLYCFLLLSLSPFAEAQAVSYDLAEASPEYTLPPAFQMASSIEEGTAVSSSSDREDLVEGEAETPADAAPETETASAPEGEPAPEENACGEACSEGEAPESAPASTEAIVYIDLVEAQRRAIVSNPSLAAGAERVCQAKQLVAQARSMYFPQVDLNYTYTVTTLPSGYTDPLLDYLDQTQDVVTDVRRKMYLYTVSNPMPFNLNRRTLREWLNSTDDALDEMRDYLDSPQKNTAVNITAGWLLFDGFAREFANAMARHGYGEAQAAYREGQRILLDAVAQAYYGGQFAREQVVVAQSAITFFERLRKEATARREVGRVSTSDVLNFETALYAAKGNLLRATREHELARIAMAVLIGMPEGYLPDTMQLAALEEENPGVMALPDATAMLDLAYACRPDLEQKELGLKRAQASVRREYAKFAPQIAAVAGAQTANVNETSIDVDRVTSTVGINVSMNLFSGGRRRAEVITAKHARKEAELHIMETEQKIAGEVRRALADLKAAQEALALQREAASCVEKNRDLVEKEYNAGKAMLVRLNQAQNDFVQAAGLLAQARVNLQRCWQALHASTGVSLNVIKDDWKSELRDE